jgi:hypothetical protein
MNKIETAAFDVMVAMHESMTTSNSEDWSLLLDRDTVHITALRESTETDGRKIVRMRKGKGALPGFKKLVAELPDGHDLGCVTIIMPSDADQAFGEFLAFLQRMGRAKKFSLMSIAGPATTAEAVAVFERSADLITGYYG